jgi:general secretion pathway protein C
VSAASFTQHPLYTALASRGRRAAARLRQVPVRRWRLLWMVIILLWVANNLAQAVWLLVPSPELENPPLAPPAEVTEPSKQAAQVDLAAIQSAALFGEGGIAPPPEPEPTVLPGIEQEAVDTSLNLRLQGVVASSDPDSARAIIADGNKQDLYKVGDKLPKGNNVTLVKVLDQRVILDNNGRYESLWLYSKEDAERRASAGGRELYSSQQADPEEAGVRYSETVAPPPAEEYNQPPPAEDMPEDMADGAEPEPEVRTLPSSVAEEITSISDVVRFTAARGNQGMMGYQVHPGRNRELFEQAGLQPGDIVTAVNGIRLDDPQQIRAVYQELQSATQAELSILRDGEPVSVYLSLDSAR